MELLKLTAQDLIKLPRSKTVFFFAVGPLEDHGPHLPLGLDVLEAQKLCELTAERLEAEQRGWVAVMMPAVPLGIQSDTVGVRITVRAHVLRDYLVDTGLSLKRMGFKHFVCFSGHLGPRQLTAIEEAGRKLSKQGWIARLTGRWAFGEGEAGPSFAAASSALVTRRAVWRAPLWVDAVEHGGSRDTSVGLIVADQNVDSTFVHLPTVTREVSWARRMAARLFRRGPNGYWGVPSRARPDLGEQALDEAVGEVFPKLKAVWEGAHAPRVFYSGYALLPPNRSFFAAWLMTAAFVGIVLAWFYLFSGAVIPLE